MFFKFGLLAVFCLLVVSTNCESNNDVILDLGPKILALQQQIGELIGGLRTQLGNVRDLINQIVNDAQATVDAALKALQDRINNVGNTVANAGDCVNQATADLNQLSLNALQLCRTSPALDLVGEQLSQLGQISGQLSRTISLCIAQNPLNVSGLRSCIEAQIANAEELSANIGADITKTLDDALTQAKECVSNTLGNLLASLDKIGSDLETCVAPLTSK